MVDYSADQRVIALSIAPYEEYSKHYTGQTTWNAWSWKIVQDLLVSPTWPSCATGSGSGTATPGSTTPSSNTPGSAPGGGAGGASEWMASIVEHIRVLAEGLVGLLIVASVIRWGWRQCLLKFNEINGYRAVGGGQGVELSQA